MGAIKIARHQASGKSCDLGGYAQIGLGTWFLIIARFRTELNACKTPDALVLDAMIPMAYNQVNAIVVDMAAVDQGAG
jgi:hypothetical protein